MATCALLSADQFQCPICLEVFSDPVTTPCGHNFCQACITACWAAPAHSRGPAPASSPPLWCPVCRETFRAGAGLRVNTGLRDLAEVFKRSSLEDSPAAAPGEVACDVCPPGPGRGRAVRSCLACLASYCGQHLKPHQQSPALQRHRLIGPAVRLEERVCPAHGRPLELFCRREQSGLCPACLRDGCHDGHEVVAASAEASARRALLGELVSGEAERRRQATLQRVQEAELRLERGREKAAEVAAVFSSLAAFLEARRAELSGAVEAGLGRLEERGRALRMESAQLLCWSEELERLCAEEDDLLLLLQKPFPPTPPSSATPSEAPCLAVDRALAALWGAVAQLEVSFSRDLEEVVRQLETPGAEAKKNKASVVEEVEVGKVQKVQKVEVQKVEVQKALGDQLGEIQRAYAVDVMLDPDTANTWLSVSRSGKQVRFDEAWREFYSTWKTFMQFPYVVGTEGFSSSFYFEAQVRGIIQWEVGVFSECVIGHERTLTVGEKRWTVCLDQGRYHAYSKYTASIHVSSPPEKVGVFVDFAHCQVLFYNVHTRSLMHCFSGSQIRQGSGRVFPAFSVGKAEDKMSSPPIVLTPICC